MRAMIFAFALLFSTLAVEFAALGVASAATVDLIAKSQAELSIVLVEGSEHGTAFTIAHRGDASYFLTSAHLINKNRYERNARLPASDAKKTASDWLTIYDPFDAQSYRGKIIGTPDFTNDILAFKVQAMQHRPRPLCLARSMPDTPPFSASSFQVDILQNTPAKKFSDYAFTVDGTSTTPVLPGAAEFQYSLNQEQGFSGGPIFDRESGAVFGMVRRSPLVPDSLTNSSVVSQNTRYGVTIDAIREYLRKLAADDGNLGDLPGIDESDRTTIFPKMTGALRILSFDFPRSGNDLAPIYQPFDDPIRKVIAARFRHRNGTAALDWTTSVYPIKKRMSEIRNLCRMPTGDDAAGILALRRELTIRPKMSLLEARVALVACDGRIIDAAGLTPTAVSAESPTRDQVNTFVRNLNGALDVLSASSDDQRLKNFAADGLPLADSEHRGFYQVRHDAALTLMGVSWVGGVSADLPDLTTEALVSSIDGVTPDDLQKFSTVRLEGHLQREGRAVSAVIVAPDGTTKAVKLGTADRCAYLQRGPSPRVGITARDKDEIL